MEQKNLLEKEIENAKDRSARETVAVRVFEAHGILPEWYSFSVGPRPVYCENERRVRGSAIELLGMDCANVCDVYNTMFHALLKYKKKCEFEQGDAAYYVQDITVMAGEPGHYDHYSENGKYVFLWDDMFLMGEKSKEVEDKVKRMEQAGYAYYRYDQYMGITTFKKETDASAFYGLLITLEMMNPQAKSGKSQAVLEYPIPDVLRDEIFEKIQTNTRKRCYYTRAIEDYYLCEKIIAYFTEEKLLKDAVDFLK